MADNFNTTPVTFGEFAFLADNYHWDSQEDALKRFKALVAQSRFPLFPDSLSVIVAGYARIVSTLLAARLQYGDAEGDSSAAPANRTLLPAFLDNVRQHCRRERGVVFYSNLANLTPKYFSKQIKQLSGKSPGTIIEEYTMTEAKSLLASKKYSVKEVSNLMNFSSPSSFCKYFKAAEGCPPGQYMKHT